MKIGFSWTLNNLVIQVKQNISQYQTKKKLYYNVTFVRNLNYHKKQINLSKMNLSKVSKNELLLHKHWWRNYDIIKKVAMTKKWNVIINVFMYMMQMHYKIRYQNIVGNLIVNQYMELRHWTSMINSNKVAKDSIVKNYR